MRTYFIVSNMLIACFLWSLSGVSPTFAQTVDPDNHWAAFDIRMSYSGMGFSTAQRAMTDTGQIVYTTSTTTSGLMFSCVGGDLMVAVSLKPQNFRETFQKTTRRHKARRVYITLDEGEKTDLKAWIFKPSLDGLSSLKPWQAARLYNAVVRKQKVTLFVQRRKPLVLDLPEIDEAFATFGTGCGLGRKQ